MSKVRATSPVEPATRVRTAADPAGGRLPARQVTPITAPARPGSHQPAKGPEVT